jgi:hypothetical protein
VSESRQHLVEVLRRTGLTEVAAEAQRTLPDPAERPELDRFCQALSRAHGLSSQSLMELLGGSP